MLFGGKARICLLYPSAYGRYIICLFYPFRMSDSKDVHFCSFSEPCASSHGISFFPIKILLLFTVVNVSKILGIWSSYFQDV